MLACQKTEQVVSRYVVGALPPWSRIAVARHLDHCTPCRRLVESHHRVAFLLEAVEPKDPPVGLWNGVVNEIASDAPGSARIPSAPRDWRPGLLVATAGVAVGVLLGQTLGNVSTFAPSPIAVAPQPSPAISTFVQQHSRLAAQDPLADPISLGAYVTIAYRENERLERNMGRRR